jgi:hypothetical protein
MDELIQSWSNRERALHYSEQARKFREMAATENIVEIRAKMLELAAQYDGLARRLGVPEGPPAVWKR